MDNDTHMTKTSHTITTLESLEDLAAKPGDVPSAGTMTKSASTDFDAKTYDASLHERQNKTLY